MGWEGIEWGGWWWDWAVGDGIRRLGVGLGGGGGIPEVGGGRIPSPPPLTSKHLTVLPTTQQHMTSHFMCVFAGSIWGRFYSAIGCSETKPRATLKSRKLYICY